HLLFGMESTAARAEAAAGQTLLFNRVLDAAELAAGVEAVTAGDIARLGERLLSPKTLAGAVLGPKSAMGAGDVFARAAFG
ncbi:MAG: M16 family metallopeptidase, partial [Caulobacteraceae bacterium]